MLGSVAGGPWDQLPTVTVGVLATTALLSLFGRRLTVPLAGDESATGLGVDVNRLRAVLALRTCWYVIDRCAAAARGTSSARAGSG